MTDQPTPAPVRATRLEDLKRREYAVPIRYPDGETVEVGLRPLSEQRMWDLRRAVTWPKPPVKDATKNGLVYDREDPAYLAGMEDANRRLGHLILLASIQLDIPGETEDDKIAALTETLGPAELTVLVVAARRINIVDLEEVAALGRSFRST